MQRVRRILKRIRQRPFRAVEAVAVIAGAVGVTLAPDTVEAVGTLVALVVGGGEVAQLGTESREHGDHRVAGAWHAGAAEGRKGTTPDRPADLPDATDDPRSGKAQP